MILLIPDNRQFNDKNLKELGLSAWTYKIL